MKRTKSPRRRGAKARPKTATAWRLPSGESLAEFVLRAGVTPPPCAPARAGGRP